MRQNKAFIFWCTWVTVNERSTTCGLNCTWSNKRSFDKSKVTFLFIRLPKLQALFCIFMKLHYQWCLSFMMIFTVIRTLMEKIVLSSVLHESKATSSLCKVDLTKEDNLEKKSDVGFGATNEINDLLKKDTVTNKSFKSVKKDCITFISYMLTLWAF